MLNTADAPNPAMTHRSHFRSLGAGLVTCIARGDSTMMNLYKHSDREIGLLSNDKKKIIEKYNIKLGSDLIWKLKNGNGFEHKIMKHSFMVKNGTLAVIFRIYELCAAKLTYFKDNKDKFKPYYYDTYSGFTKTELWNVEFFRHIETGVFVDLRSLQRIRNVEVFKEWCRQLETHTK